VTHGGRLADARIGDQDAQARLLGQVVEMTLESGKAGRLFKEGPALSVFGQWVMGQTKTLSIHGSNLLFGIGVSCQMGQIW
jgi:hypothetical protein